MLAAAASGIGLGLGSLLGVIVLVGMYARNLMALFGRYLVLPVPTGSVPVSASVRGARERFVPIFVSAVALVALLVPWLVLGTGPGLEVIEPMAVVVLGGLVTTTAMSLFFLPLMYLRIARTRTRPTWTHRSTVTPPSPASPSAEQHPRALRRWRWSMRSSPDW